MGVEGLTRENIASHLQKYRRLLEKKAGLPGTGPVAAADWPRLEAAQAAHLVSVRKQMEDERRQRGLDPAAGLAGLPPPQVLQPNLAAHFNFSAPGALPQFAAPAPFPGMLQPQVRLERVGVEANAGSPALPPI